MGNKSRDLSRRALGIRALRIEHIGSTAVPGLAAKPIIDLLVTVDDPEDDTSTLPALTSTGYELRVREPGHRMLRTPQRDVHLHVRGDADPEVTRSLRFRDRLRESPEDRQAYERLKRDLARRDWADAIARVEITPGERFVHLIKTLFGLAREGHVNKRGMPHPLQLALALITTEFADVIVFRRPPAAVQRVLFGALAPIARRRDYRATYPSLSRTTWAPRQPSAPNLEAEP